MDANLDRLRDIPLSSKTKTADGLEEKWYDLDFIKYKLTCNEGKRGFRWPHCVCGSTESMKPLKFERHLETKIVYFPGHSKWC